MNFSKSNIKIFIPVILVIGICFGFIGCGSMQKTQPVITVTIQPQKYLLEKIVGDKYNVVCLLAQGSNPEAYEPSLNHIMNLEKSDAYFCIGNIGFELAIKNRVASNAPDLKIVDTSKGIALLKGTHEGSEVGSGHSHEIDPHVWTSVPNAKIIAKNMYDAVVEMDPKHKKYYTKNYDNLVSELDTLNSELTRQLAPIRGTSFAVWHPSLSYFARDYGLKQIAMENEGKEVTANMLKSEIDHAKKAGVKVMFYQKEFDSRQVETINNQLGTRLVEINPMNYNWVEEMHIIANALTEK